MAARFKNRVEAGRALAARLSHLAPERGVVLGLPRGGVPVAREIAAALGWPLDVFVVRKLGTPGHEELAMGAIATGGARVLNEDVVRHYGVSPQALEAVAERERLELERRERAYRGQRPPPDVQGRTAVLVDDGLATGATMRAAVLALRGEGPARVVVAVPVGAPQVCAAMERVADEVVCVLTPASLRGVGLWYDDFSQVPDEEVRALLEPGNSARREVAP